MKGGGGVLTFEPFYVPFYADLSYLLVSFRFCCECLDARPRAWRRSSGASFKHGRAVNVERCGRSRDLGDGSSSMLVWIDGTRLRLYFS